MYLPTSGQKSQLHIDAKAAEPKVVAGGGRAKEECRGHHTELQRKPHEAMKKPTVSHTVDVRIPRHSEGAETEAPSHHRTRLRSNAS